MLRTWGLDSLLLRGKVPSQLYRHPRGRGAWEGLWLLPGHTVVQAVFWKACPSQKAPPLSGAGLVQVRVRFCQPRPHRLEQGDHSAQLDQPPFTGGMGHHTVSLDLGFSRSFKPITQLY